MIKRGEFHLAVAFYQYNENFFNTNVAWQLAKASVLREFKAISFIIVHSRVLLPLSFGRHFCLFAYLLEDNISDRYM